MPETSRSRARRPVITNALDPPWETEPQEVGLFGLRGSVGVGFAGTFAINVTQVTVSSNGLEYPPG